MSRNQLKAILKINGFAADSNEEDIRRVLLNANYSESEIEAALLILKSDVSVQSSRIDGLHKVFYTHGQLRPSEVSTLLGVDINISSPISNRSLRSAFGFKEVLMVTVSGVLLAVITVLLLMYLTGVGVFHPVAANF